MNTYEATGGPMKICFAIDKRYGGGAERALSELSSILAEMGHDITVIQKNSADWEYPISEKVKIHVLDQPKNRLLKKLRLGYIERLKIFRQKVREVDPEILVPYLAWADKYSFWTAKLERRKLINTIRCNPARSPKKKLSRILRNIRCFFSDKIYVQNKGEGSYFPAFMQKKIFVIPNITKEEFFALTRPQRSEIRHFVSAGRMTPQKNQQMLIRAFSKIVKKFPEKQLTLNIFGQGILHSELEALIKQLSMEDHIFMPGFSNDLAAEYAESDAFVMVSNYEGQPNALMEAMATGLPCISTDCPNGPSELIEHGINGVLIPCNDEQRLELELERLITDPSAARELGEKAREYMQTLCDREKIGQAFIKQCMELRNKT